MGKTAAQRAAAYRARSKAAAAGEAAPSASPVEGLLESAFVTVRELTALVSKLHDENVMLRSQIQANGPSHSVTVLPPDPPEISSIPSDSLEIPSKSESESTRAPVTNDRHKVTNGASKDAERYIALDDPLDRELEAIAQLANVQDIKAAWLKFTGYYAGKWVHVSGRWQKWCVREALEERQARERARELQSRKGGDLNPPEQSSPRLKPLSEAQLRKMAPGLFDDGMGTPTEAKAK